MTAAAPGVRRVDVPSEGGEYPVMVAPGLRHELGGLVRRLAPEVRAWAVIADSNVAPLYGTEALASLEAEDVALDLHVFPAGERHKSRETWARLTDELLASGLGRDGGVVAVGGGVTGDLAGFVAATYMRGVSVIQVPTSVVAMVDSAVGGKTGVDTAAGKNLVGSFHAPRLVVVDPETVSTLAPEERAQGWAEAVKHGAILDEAYLASLEEDVPGLLAGDLSSTFAAVLRSIEIKTEVVGRDEREGGMREVLNFGHTLGHALEAASGYALPHGSAVAVGMVLEARLGEALGITHPGSADSDPATNRAPLGAGAGRRSGRDSGADGDRQEGARRRCALRSSGETRPRAQRAGMGSSPFPRSSSYGPRTDLGSSLSATVGKPMI